MNYKKGPIKLTADVEQGGFINVVVLDKSGYQISKAKEINKTIDSAVLEFDNEINEENIKLIIEIEKAKPYSFVIN